MLALHYRYVCICYVAGNQPVNLEKQIDVGLHDVLGHLGKKHFLVLRGVQCWGGHVAVSGNRWAC